MPHERRMCAGYLIIIFVSIAIMTKYTTATQKSGSAGTHVDEFQMTEQAKDTHTKKPVDDSHSRNSVNELNEKKPININKQHETKPVNMSTENKAVDMLDENIPVNVNLETEHVHALQERKRVRFLHENNQNNGTHGTQSLYDMHENKLSYLYKHTPQYIYRYFTKRSERNNNKCDVAVTAESIMRFQSYLLQETQFVQFRIRLKGNTTHKTTNSVFQPDLWYWSKNTSAGPYPFLFWNIDYGLYSFGLLDAKSINVPDVDVSVDGNCDLTFGTDETSLRITTALYALINISGHYFHTYKQSYFCYMNARKHIVNTIPYYIALYINYPTPFIIYKCCTVTYHYEIENITYDCPENIPGGHKWEYTISLPYSFGIIMLAYCPITMLEIFAWMSKRERIAGNEDDHNLIAGSATDNVLNENEDKWIFANGRSPLIFLDLLSFDIIGLDKTCPLIVSRLRRLLCILLMPSVIYIQLYAYRNGVGFSKESDTITVKDLVDVGVPMSVLSILGDSSNSDKVFVPYLGGPVGVIILYFALGLLFIVFPRSLKQIVEDGLPGYFETVHTQLQNRNHVSDTDVPLAATNRKIDSPLFFGAMDIVKLSMLDIEPDDLNPGYIKGATLMTCNCYMLFTKHFWLRVWIIQKNRIYLGERVSICKKVVFLLSMPIYGIVCALEIVCCVIYYGIPFCFWVVVVVKGATRGLGYLKDQIRCLSFIFRFRFFIALGVSVVFVLFSVYTYLIALLFLNSFTVICKVVIMCFISIIMYPTVSFGYLFFVVTSLYYCIRQIRHFGNVYADLLSTAVDIADGIEEDHVYLSITHGHLSIANIRYENMKDIRINGRLLDISHNLLRTVYRDGVRKVRENNDALGIPIRLFEYLVEQHRPVHQQVLSLFLKVSTMVAFIFVTMSLTSCYSTGPSTNMSEIMHVIFIVAVGALPELIEVTVSNYVDASSEREIENKLIKQSIIDYWND